MNADSMFAPIDPAEVSGPDAPEAVKFRPMTPTSGLEKDDIRHSKLGKPSCVWAYHDAIGRLDGYVCRFETSGQDGKADKEFRPYRYGAIADGQARWHWKGWGDSRPLYNLRELQVRPDARVIVTEGEKKADAAGRLFPDCVAVSPMNGAKSPHKTAWSPVAGRSLVIWPDNDMPGRGFAGAAAKLAQAAGAADVAVVEVPPDWPQKWDLADAPPDGVEIGTLNNLLASAIPWTSSTDRRAKGPASEDAVTAEVRRLAAASPVTYELEREAAAERLGVRVSVLDRLVKREREDGGDALKPGQGRPVEIPEVEPWPEPVDGAVLLEDLAQSVRAYVVMTTRQADAVALWILFTHLFEAFDFSPKLVIGSPEKRSGKTRLVEVAERLTRRPLFVSGISPAALLRVIEQYAPAMLIDEIDTLMKGDADMAEALRGLINSGFSRAGARFIKNVPSPEGGYEPRAFSTWCPMLLAGIGKLPDTVADRSIIIGMARKRPDEKVKRLRERDGAELHILCRKAARWAADSIASIKQADPKAPEQLNDRAADAWSPLFAIADLAGGAWPERARKAAMELSGGGESAETTREMLLADLREMFDAEPSGVLFTREIIAALHKREDRPWSEWGKAGKPIAGRQVAGLLKPLGVKTNQTVRRGIDHDKGYRVEWLEDAFARYLPLSIGDTVTNEEIRGSRAESIGDTRGGRVTDTSRQKPSVSAGCHRVIDRIPQGTGNGVVGSDVRPNVTDPGSQPKASDEPPWMFDGSEPTAPNGSKRGRVII
jgi:putative DNA primase/helicase